MLKSLILLRKYSLGLIITITLAFIAFNFKHYEKVLIFINSDLSFYDLTATTPFVLIIFFLSGSLVICILYLLSSRIITPEVIIEYEAWFFTSIFTYFSYSLCTIFLHVNNLLISDSPVDVLFKNRFLLIKRLWSYEELDKIVQGIISSHKGITFTEAEVSKILISNSVEEVVSITEELCRIKLEQLTDVKNPIPSSSWNDF